MDRAGGSRDGGTRGLAAAAAGLLLVLPVAGADPYLLDVMTTGLLLAVLAGSWDLVGGVAGQPSLGHAAFFGTATYGCALLTSLAGLPFPVAAGGALALCGAAAWLAGTLAAPLSGPFAALFTLAVGELLHEAALGLPIPSPSGVYSWGGEGGVPVALPWSDPSPWVSYYGALAFLLASALAMRRLARSGEGLLWRAVAGSELFARASGVDVERHKRLAYLAGGLFAGAAGVGYAAHVGRATAADFSVELSFQAAAFAAVGGRGTVVGPVLAALVLHAALQGSGIPPSGRVLLYAAVLLVALRFFPGGVAAAFGRRRNRK